MNRNDLYTIVRWIKPGARVLDLGCGDGTLLKLLRDSPIGASGYGFEINPDSVLSCIQKGLNVIQQDIEKGLALFEDQSFNTVILSQTLQTIHRTAAILGETLRVGEEVIVTFPNFAYWTHRWTVLRGRLPVSKALPFQWHDTPNVRVITITDFERLAQEVGFEILDRIILSRGRPVHWGARWRGSLAIYRIKKKT